MSIKEALAQWGKRIQQASREVDDIEAKLDCRRKDMRQVYRHIPLLTNLEFVVPSRPTERMLMQEQNWLNGGEDVHIQGVMASVWVQNPDDEDGNTIINFVKTDAGFSVRRFSEGGTLLRHVDFGWNIRVGRTGQYLLSPANGGQLLGSTTIRKDRAGKVQWFSNALRVPAGENILVQMKPLRLPLDNADSFWTSSAFDLRISIALYGTRTGALHV